jgi:hypothetical protein
LDARLTALLCKRFFLQNLKSENRLVFFKQIWQTFLKKGMTQNGLFLTMMMMMMTVTTMTTTMMMKLSLQLSLQLSFYKKHVCFFIAHLLLLVAECHSQSAGHLQMQKVLLILHLLA